MQWRNDESISSELRNKTSFPLLSFLYSIILEDLATEIRQEKEVKVIQIEKEEIN